VSGRARTWAEAVYAVVKVIPRGKVATYGQVAALLGRPRGGREVGWALHGCPDPRVPCHRVVDRNGRLAPHFRQQRASLTAEGVRVRSDRVDLDIVRWQPHRDALLTLGRVADRGFLDEPRLDV